MKKVFVILGIIAFLIISCSQSHKNIVDEGAYPAVNMKLREVAFDEHTMFPTDVLIFSDSILVVHERKNQIGFLTAYNILTNQLLSAFGAIGDGPNDFLNPRILHDLTTNENLYIGDLDKITRFSIDSITTSGYNGEKIQTLPSEIKGYNYLLIDNDSLIAYNQAGEHPLSVFNKQAKSLRFTDYYPEIDWKEGSEYIKNTDVFANCMTSNGELIAIAYHNWNTISIITPNGDVIKELYFPDWDYNIGKMSIDPTTKNLRFDENAKIYFTKIRSNDNYIFALGWSATKAQIKNGEVPSFILVMDWEGNIIRKINFDRSVASFCINNETIPYVTAMGDDGEIHVFGCDLQ